MGECVDIFNISLFLCMIIYHFEKYWQNTSDKIDISFIRMFKLGPEVSLRGSPTVSPITAAL